MSLIAHGIQVLPEPLFTVQLPDGSTVQKRSQDLQPDDMLVFGGDCETRQIEYRPQPMVWDFDDMLPPPRPTNRLLELPLYDKYAGRVFNYRSAADGLQWDEV